MHNAQYFRTKARSVLKGNWSVAVLTGLVASILGADTCVSAGRGGSGITKLFSDNSEFYVNMPEFLVPIFHFIGGLVIALSIFYILIGGAVTLGYARFNLNLVDQTSFRFQDLFSEFDRFLDGFTARILTLLYTFLWSLLLVIPGIIAAFSYSMTPYIMIDHPELGANEAISRSKELMKGHKWQLFCLKFSFLGWAILSALTCGIGFLWLTPYTEAASAAFYRNLVETEAAY